MERDLDNIYNGVNEAIPVRGFNYRIFGVDPYQRSSIPASPYWELEMGSTAQNKGYSHIRDSANGYMPDEDFECALVGNYGRICGPGSNTVLVDRRIRLVRVSDYRGADLDKCTTSIRISRPWTCGFPRKNIYYYYQSWWTDEDVLHISPDWNPQYWCKQ